MSRDEWDNIDIPYNSKISITYCKSRQLPRTEIINNHLKLKDAIVINGNYRLNYKWVKKIIILNEDK